MPTYRLVLSLAATLLVVFAACGGARGRDCDTDSDCDSVTECISPGCGSTQKKCAITCKTNADCAAKGDSADRCVKPNANCVAYCTPGG